MYKIKQFGPFTIARCRVKKENKHFVDISLTRWSGNGFGWEWGGEDDLSTYSVIIRAFGINWFALRKGSFEVWLAGFWWIK